MQGLITPKLISTLLKQNKGSYSINNILKTKKKTSGKNKWNQLYSINEESWEYICQATFQISKCTKLRWLQMTGNHRKLITNNFLYHIIVKDSSKCKFCGAFEKTIPHLF